ncbi:MAG: signal peptidase I [Lachnospiraceae bacterium]|nr:signal peptidase I [Lachnospiraceae bacterium]
MAIRRRSHDYRGGTLHTQPVKRKVNFGHLYEILTWVSGIVLAGFLGAFVVYAFGIRTSVIGDSMEPVLSAGQEILLDRIVYQFSSPDRGDVIVFHPNGNQNTHLYVKRVVGLPGETVQIKQGRLYINGIQYAQDYSGELMEPGIAENPIKLDVEDYFVLGDNRAESEDSRSADIGTVTRDMIEGKAWLHLERDAEEGIGRIE